jgi:hypothetical protein
MPISIDRPSMSASPTRLAGHRNPASCRSDNA